MNDWGDWEIMKTIAKGIAGEPLKKPVSPAEVKTVRVAGKSHADTLRRYVQWQFAQNEPVEISPDGPFAEALMEALMR